jgi:hypothetical protein
MRAVLDPFRFVITTVTGWMNPHQQHVIDYLREENRVLWHIKYFVGNSKTLWDEGFEQWHSDGTELNNDNAVPPSLGNVCVGVYKQTGPRTFKLRHVTWNFDVSGALTGTFELLQTVTVSNNGKTFIGTYTSDRRDLSGNIIPSLHAEGVLSATRITVD